MSVAERQTGQPVGWSGFYQQMIENSRDLEKSMDGKMDRVTDGKNCSSVYYIDFGGATEETLKLGGHDSAPGNFLLLCAELTDRPAH